MYQSAAPFERQLSQLSSLTGELDTEDYIQPHYKEAYRLAIYALVSGGKDAYYDFLKAEQIGNFLSERELLYILENVEQPAESHRSEETADDACSSGTYWPMESDLETPDLDLGWPTVVHEIMETSINLLFHPPRQNCPTIKEVIRKHIQEAKQVIAIVMDIFTDVDIFKEIVEASLRGIAVYVLLDDFHIKDFLSMAEQQDVQIQKLGNMRVRTVKGLGYLCRSGARFHGAMEQKFILVDSQTVVYGSYSFMWSYEKINLSLVQVITGQLVKGFDEEFRVLFARSTAPTVGLMESVSLDGKHNGVSSVGVCAPRFTQPFTRRDQPNHILDMVYKRACGRQPGSKHSMAENEVKLRNKRPVDNRSAINHSNGTQHRLHQLQGMDTCDFLKRHSYGGERQEGPCIPNQSTETNASSNWNAIRGGDLLRPGRVSRLYNRDISKRQSYHGTDKQVLSLQESLPSWEQTTKSCLRMRRIKSYLDNTDSHDGNSNDNGEPAGTQCDGLDSRPNQYVLSRLRSSIVFTSTIPEHPESNVNTTSTSSTQCGSSTSRTPYPSMRWNPVKSVESRMRQDDYSFKRHSFHTLDEPSGSKNLGPVREPYQPVYLNHDRTRGNQSVQNPDIRKKYSLAEPTPNAENGASEEPPSGRVCGGLSENGESEGSALTKRARAEIPPLNNLRESHRSVSHCDVRNIVEKKNPLAYNWQEPLNRAVSTANLCGELKETNFDSPFFKNGPKKIKTLLNIPEKSENEPGLKTGSGSREEDRIPSKENKVCATSVSTKSTGAASPPGADVKLLFEENYFAEKTGESSTPCFSTEQLQSQDQCSLPSNAAAGKQRLDPVRNDGLCTATEAWRRDPRGDSRVYSRYEPFCTFEKKPSEYATLFTSTAHQEERQRSLLNRSSSANERHYNNSNAAYRTQSRSDNKFGRFMQRVGNLIHKNK